MAEATPPASKRPASSPALGESAVGARDAASDLMRAAIAFAATMAIFLVLIPGQFIDPFIRSDDYPALFATPEEYRWKTLGEGRWLNYLWTYRPWPTDPRILFALYMSALVWAFACVGAGITRATPAHWPAVGITVALTAIPQTALISLWPATLLPATLLLAAFATVALVASAQATERALSAATPLMLMAHTAYPLVLLAIAAAIGRDRPTGWTTFRLGLIFCIALPLGMLAIYTLNLMAHGEFGLRLANWREPNPLTDMASLVTNLETAAISVASGFSAAFLEMRPLVFVMLATMGLALVIMPAAVRDRRNRLALAVLLVLAVPAAHMLLTGLVWPARSLGVFAVVVIVIAASAAVAAGSRVLRLWFAVAIMLAGGLGLWSWQDQIAVTTAPYQAETRRIAAQLGVLREPEQGTTVLIAGQVGSLAPVHILQNSIGAEYRLQLLTGGPVYFCDLQLINAVRSQLDMSETVDPAAAEADPFLRRAVAVRDLCLPHLDALHALSDYPAAGSIAPLAPGIVGLRLPETLADGVENLAEDTR